MDPILQFAVTAFLKAALESSMMQDKMVAEGRTKMTPEEEKQLQDITDAAGIAARSIGLKL